MVQWVRLQDRLAVQVVRLDDVHRLLHLLLLLQVQWIYTVPDSDGHRVVLQDLLAIVVLMVMRMVDRRLLLLLLLLLDHSISIRNLMQLMVQ